MTNQQVDKLPHSRQAEENLLGAILINPKSYYHATGIIQASDFYIHRHRWVWSAYESLHERKINVDFSTVIEELDRKAHLENVGGAAYLMKLTSGVPSSLHTEEYATIVKEKAQRRNLIDIANRMANLAHNDEADVEEEQSKFIQEISSNASVPKGSVHVSKWASRGFDRLEEYREQPPLRLSTGISDLDRVMGRPGVGVTIIAGKPKLGKSILLQSIITNLARDGIPGAFYSLEMPEEHFDNRITSALSSIPVSKMYDGNLTGDEWNRITKSVERREGWPLWVNDGRMSTSNLYADLARLKENQGIKWFALDYLELLTDERRKKGWERAAYLGRRLTEITKELRLAGIVVQKLIKSGWDKIADLNEISGGGDVSYDAISLVVLCEHTPKAGEEEPNMRTVVNLGPPRLEERYDKFCHLVKSPDLPIMSGIAKEPEEFYFGKEQ